MKPPDNDRGEYLRNMAFAAMAGQAGCASVIVIIGALFLGIWLDGVFDTRPALTLALVLTSVPVSLVLMVYMALQSTKKITPPKPGKTYRRSVHQYDDDEDRS